MFVGDTAVDVAAAIDPAAAADGVLKGEHAVPGGCTLDAARRSDPALDALVAAVGDYHAAGASVLDGDRLRARAVGLSALASMIDAARLDAIAALDDSAAFEADGSATAAGWLARHTPADRRSAAADVRVARRSVHAPGVAAALAAGTIGARAAAMLTNAAADDPAGFAELEDPFIDVAAHGTLRDLRNVLAEWAQLTRPDADPQGDYDEHIAKRRTHLSITLDGVGHLNATFDPVTAAEILTTLDARTDHLRRTDLAAIANAAAAARDQGLLNPAVDPDAQRSPAQYRADALVDLIRAGAELLTATTDDRRTPACATRVTVRVDAEDLLDYDGANSPADLVPATIGDSPLLLPHAEIDTLVCDCHIRRVITTAEREILDVGRTQRTVTPAIRTGLIARDHGCAFPGCDRPPRWCDAHHIKHFKDLGITSLINTILLCRRHHRLIHTDDAWTIRCGTDGAPPVIAHHDIDQPRNRPPPRLRDLIA